MCTSSYSYIVGYSFFFSMIIFVLYNVCGVFEREISRPKSCVFVKRWAQCPMCRNCCSYARLRKDDWAASNAYIAIYEACASSNNRRRSVFYNVRAFRITDYVILYVLGKLFFWPSRFSLTLCVVVFFSEIIILNICFVCYIRFSCWWFCCRRFYSITLVFPFAFYLL